MSGKLHVGKFLYYRSSKIYLLHLVLKYMVYGAHTIVVKTYVKYIKLHYSHLSTLQVYVRYLIQGHWHQRNTPEYMASHANSEYRGWHNVVIAVVGLHNSQTLHSVIIGFDIWALIILANLKTLIDSLRPSDAHMRRQSRPSLAQIMAILLVGAKPLSEPMLEYCLLIGTSGTNFCDMLIETHSFSLTKMHLIMSSGYWRPFSLDLNMFLVLIPYW